LFWRRRLLPSKISHAAVRQTRLLPICLHNQMSFWAVTLFRIVRSVKKFSIKFQMIINRWEMKKLFFKKKKLCTLPPSYTN
jgi:hypothetical protein